MAMDQVSEPVPDRTRDGQSGQRLFRSVSADRSAGLCALLINGGGRLTDIASGSLDRIHSVHHRGRCFAGKVAGPLDRRIGALPQVPEPGLALIYLVLNRLLCLCGEVIGGVPNLCRHVARDTLVQLLIHRSLHCAGDAAPASASKQIGEAKHSTPDRPMPGKSVGDRLHGAEPRLALLLILERPGRFCRLASAESSARVVSRTSSRSLRPFLVARWRSRALVRFRFRRFCSLLSYF